MDKNVMIAVCSPRPNGNCAILAEKAAAGARAGGARVELVSIPTLDPRPCTACLACQDAGATDCVLDDGLTRLLPRLRAAGALLIVSPIYWFTFAAQAKVFIDRAFFSLNGPEGHALKGRKLGLILAYGGADPFDSGAVNALRAFQDTARFIGADITGMVCGSANDPGEIAANPAVLEQAFDLGQTLAAG